MLDLLDSSSVGQSALEAQSLGVDAILFHKPADDEGQFTFADIWEMVRGNTKLPLVAGEITRNSIKDIVAISPHGIVLSKTITAADNPRDEAEFYFKIVKSE